MTSPYDLIRPIALTEEDADYASAYLAARVSVTLPGGCHMWKLSVNAEGDRGRPIAWVKGRRYVASRLAWALVHGYIPDGLIVCHTCDQPRCINIRHLFLGTQADNSHDRDRKGRFTPLPGESNGKSRHADGEVFALLERWDRGEFKSQHEMAAEAGVSDNTASRWIRGITARTASRRVRTELPVPEHLCRLGVAG